MKLKQRPEDFRVEEFPTVTPVPPGSPGGPFAFYRLDKRGWTTPDALNALRRRWKVDFRRLSYGGLQGPHPHTTPEPTLPKRPEKQPDHGGVQGNHVRPPRQPVKARHADPPQYLTTHNGPEKHHDQGGFKVTYVGRLAEPYTSEHVRANGFTVTLRSLSAADVERARAALPEVADVGVPNYFDDQRFGSVGDGTAFVAREMVLGNFEGALKLALAAPYEHDRAEGKKEKAILTARWGDWPAAKAELPRGHARSIVDYLVHHPTDFKGACVRLR